MNIIYCRISKGENYQDSSHQLRSCQDFAKAHNIEIDTVIEDQGISAYSKDWHEREGFSKVMALAERGLENLIVFESSRISRQFMQGQNIIDYFTQHNVKVWSVVDNCQLNENELSQLWNSFRYFMNQKSSKENSDRQKSKKRHMKEQGQYTGYPIMLGFKVVDGKEVVNEDKRQEVISIFESYIRDGSKATMERYGFKHHQTLLYLLKNEKYLQIIPKSLFDQVQKVIQSRKCSTRGVETRGLNRTDVLLEGLLYHKHCNKKLNIDMNRGTLVFRCRNCRGKVADVKKSFTGEKLTNNIEHDLLTVFDNLSEQNLRDTYNNRCSKSKTQILLKIKELEDTIKAKEKALSLANVKLERYIVEEQSDAMISAISNVIKTVTNDIANAKAELEHKTNELLVIKEQEQHQEEVIHKIIDAKEIYKNATISQKKNILNLIVDRIEVSDTDSFDIYLKL